MNWDLTGAMLCKMRAESCLCDFTMAASDFETTQELISAHSVIMAASCTLVYRFLITNNIKLNDGESMQITDVDTVTLSVAVDFIYGKLPTDEESVLALRKAARILELPAADNYLNTLDIGDRQTKRDEKVNSSPESRQCIAEEAELNPSVQIRLVYSCPICDKIYQKEMQLENHIKSNHFVTHCPLCLFISTDCTSHILSKHACTKSVRCATLAPKLESSMLTSKILSESESYPENIFLGESSRTNFPGTSSSNVSTTADALSNLIESFSSSKIPNIDDIIYGAKHCIICDDEFEGPKDMHQHLIIDHQFIQCLHCLQTLPENHLQEHLDKYHSDMYTCKYCQDTFELPFLLLEHIYKKHKEDEVYMCSICIYQSYNTPEMIQHFSEFHEILSSYSELRACNAILTKHNFKLLSQLYNILNGAERNETWKEKWLTEGFQCGACRIIHGNPFDLADDILNHLQNDREYLDSVQSDIFECWNCDKTFTDQRIYSAHRKYHADERSRSKFRCTVCSFTAVCYSKLIVHLKSHSSIKPYKCQLCKKGFKSSYTRDAHMVVHSNTKSFKCDSCEATFKYKQSLNMHKKRLHDPDYIRPFVCSMCNYKAHTKPRLVFHIKSHLGERDYLCHLCEKAFTKSNNFKRHLLKVHGEVD